MDREDPEPPAAMEGEEKGLEAIAAQQALLAQSENESTEDEASNGQESQRSPYYQMVYIVALLILTILNCEHITSTLINLATNSVATYLIQRGTVMTVTVVLALLSTVYWIEPNEAYEPSRKSSQYLDQISNMANQAVTMVLQPVEKAIQSLHTRRQPNQYNPLPKRLSTRQRPNTLLRIYVASLLVMSASGRPRQVEEGGPFDTDSGLIGIDNRCTGCITNIRSDIPGELRECSRAIKGFGGIRHFKVWIGTIQWTWDDDNGKSHTFNIPNSFYVPEGKTRLLSPQHWAQTRPGKDKHGGAGETTTALTCTLFWDGGDSTRTVPLDRDSTNVASFRLSPGYTKFHAHCAEFNQGSDEATESDPITAHEAGIVSDDESDDESTAVEDPTSGWDSEGDLPTKHTEINLNGTTPEGEPPPTIIADEPDQIPDNPTAQLLRLHYSFGHSPFSKLQQMARRGILPKGLAKCNVPICSACQYAKATKRKWRPRTAKSYSPSRPTSPGEVVSVDQLVSPTPGLIAQMTGFLTKKRYKYATVFVDQYSGLGYVYLQREASLEETLEAKKAFERYAHSMGIKVKAYHADNGIFKAKGWVQACLDQQQPLTFSGVGAHHTNGKAERRIRELQEMARTALIHANKRWPEAIEAYLWPYAVRYANDCINNTPNMQDPRRRTPIQIFSGSVVEINSKHWKPFGAPVYVLNAAPRDGKPHHKWQAKASVGIYLGRSPIHSKEVALVLDRITGYVSPQFHVKVDSGFYTLDQERTACSWQVATGFKDRLPTQPSPKPSRKRGAGDMDSEGEGVTPPKKAPENPTREQGTHPKPMEEDPIQPDGSLPVYNSDNTLKPRPQGDHAMGLGTPAYEAETPGLRRSSRVRKEVKRLIHTMTAEVSNSQSEVPGEIFCYSTLFPQDESMRADPLYAFKASSDPDTMYMHQAMKEPDADQFKQAMKKEWDDQLANGNFSLIKRSEVPRGKIILPAVWQMKRKRDIKTRQIKKYKARLNIDGSRMRHGEHYDMTYAPVASWNSVRLLLALSAIHGWHTTQIDYVLAFPQAPVERDIYMEIPKGFEVEGANRKDYVLKIHRNIYGQKQAGRVWNKYLVDKLVNKVGFTQSKVDECVFYKGNVIYVLYTDDSILAGPDQAEIDKIIQQIKQAKLDITVEGDIQDFLGVNITRREDGTIEFTQPHLVDKVLEAMGLTDTRLLTKDTPAASSRILHRHSSSKPFDNSFNYRSVVGMLNYLDKGSRSDIAYATHQCARFVDQPKKEHGDALRWLARYLKGTRNKGMIYKPDLSRGLEVFVDADFSGNWEKNEAPNDRDTARSRHGYFIMYAGCPIVWKSQLQTEIALSSTESEYTGLSYALREAIPIMELLREIQKEGRVQVATTASIRCRVFEDNNGALEMAKVHKYRPRTKHLNVKLHHFRSYVEKREVTIHPIDTKDQLADYLTKPVNYEILSRLRLLVMGW